MKPGHEQGKAEDTGIDEGLQDNDAWVIVQATFAARNEEDKVEQTKGTAETSNHKARELVDSLASGHARLIDGTWLGCWRR